MQTTPAPHTLPPGPSAAGGGSASALGRALTVPHSHHAAAGAGSLPQQPPPPTLQNSSPASRGNTPPPLPARLPPARLARPRPTGDFYLRSSFLARPRRGGHVPRGLRACPGPSAAGSGAARARPREEGSPVGWRVPPRNTMRAASCAAAAIGTGVPQK